MIFTSNVEESNHRIDTSTPKSELSCVFVKCLTDPLEIHIRTKTESKTKSSEKIVEEKLEHSQIGGGEGRPRLKVVVKQHIIPAWREATTGASSHHGPRRRLLRVPVYRHVLGLLDR
jgi:hypothetical protein